MDRQSRKPVFGNLTALFVKVVPVDDAVVVVVVVVVVLVVAVVVRTVLVILAVVIVVLITSQRPYWCPFLSSSSCCCVLILCDAVTNLGKWSLTLMSPLKRAFLRQRVFGVLPSTDTGFLSPRFLPPVMSAVVLLAITIAIIFVRNNTIRPPLLLLLLWLLLLCSRTTITTTAFHSDCSSTVATVRNSRLLSKAQYRPTSPLNDNDSAGKSFRIQSRHPRRFHFPRWWWWWCLQCHYYRCCPCGLFQSMLP